MLHQINLLLLFFVALAFVACEKDDDIGEEEDIYDYHAHIQSPNTDDKHVGDTIHIEVLFESHSGETVHNVSVRLYNKADEGNVIHEYEEHVHETGEYEYQEEFVLSEDNGVMAHTDWILEAKVWPHDGEKGGQSETVEFHVHPM